jgi:fused signal recognition particle receptor
MFGGLKKRLQKVVEKFSKETEEPQQIDVPSERQSVETIEEKIKHVEQVIQKEGKSVIEKVEEEIFGEKKEPREEKPTITGAIPLNRGEAIELLKKYNKDEPDFNHFFESEAIMRALARRLGENEERWAMLGLLHDIDWGLTKNDHEKHLTKAPDILKEAGFDDEFIEITVSHGYGFSCAGLEDKKRTKKVEYALAAAETVTGLIHAYALMRGSMKNMEANGLKKKFKDKTFASSVNRDVISECEHLGLSLDEFFELSIKAVQEIADIVGLKPKEKKEHKEEKQREKKSESLKHHDDEEEIEKEIAEEKKIEELIKKDLEENKEVKIEPEQLIKEEQQEKKGFFKRLVKITHVKTLTEDEVESVLKEIKIALLENDVAYEVTEKIADDVKKDLIGKEVKREKTEVILRESLKKAMFDVMQKDRVDIESIIKTKKPFTILFLGFNGTGKTTTIAKMAYKFKNKFRIIFAAGDTFRAASIEQIEEHGNNLGISVVKHKYGSDSAAVIFDAKKHAEANNIDVVLADTAGRSHSNTNLMDELKKVVRVNKPDYKILVLDSLTGNDIYNQAKLFNDAVGVDAIILTKADVYEKGGAALSAAYTIKKPILYLGVGQDYDSLKEFDPQEVVNNLLG